ncbi:MAG: hypothetical protein KC454_02285 [Flavobacteriales bacterium]|nr:hypothetical protein [Flavobacteriales bacterium]
MANDNVESKSGKVFVASDENKAKAKQFRIFAILAFVIAIGFEVLAILQLGNNPVNMTWLISFIVVDLVFAITGSLLWKKSNRLDPASEKNQFKFFVQNQLGMIIGVIAFLPLVILIFTNKNMSGKQKGIAGSIAAVALVIAGVVGTDFNPPSVEKYTKEINEQTEVLKELNIEDNVFWSTAGNKYHIKKDCYHIADRIGVVNGTVKESWDKKGISELCKTCKAKAEKEQNIDSSNDIEELEEAAEVLDLL